MKTFLIAIILLSFLDSYAQFRYSDSIPIEPNEKWFGGAVNEGSSMPFSNGYHLNLYGNTVGNQASPFLISTTGRFIWSDQPFAFTVNQNILYIQSIDKITVEKRGNTMATAYQAASKKYFPASGKTPDTLLFSSPQYNTWIELIYNQNQQDILKYAHAIIDNGFPPGVLMIDDNWMPYYGRFEFRKDRFPDAKGMVNELHKLGFKVMIWVCPFIRPDGEEFRALLQQRLLLFDNKGDAALQWHNAKTPAIIRWWNGYSAEMDFTNPEAVKWYSAQLKKMQDEYGIDGFKLDAGDPEYYPPTSVSYKKATPNEQCEAWGQFGLMYPLNEYRAMWKRGGAPLAERLRDKGHTWEDLKTLIPNLTVAGVLGYQFTCPDMIGGGDFASFIGRDKLDQDLVVRSAQCSALMPMMQFSAAPWRVLDSIHFDAVKKAVALRMKLTPYIMQLVKETANTGEPIARTMEYVFPHEGMDNCKDQFMLGNQIMVAPMVDKGEQRTVIFPKGRWKVEDGKIIKGPAVKQFQTPIGRLLWFEYMGK